MGWRYRDVLGFKELESLDEVVTSLQGEMKTVKRQKKTLEEDIITKRPNAL